jgi:hypothetical protein
MKTKKIKRRNLSKPWGEILMNAFLVSLIAGAGLMIGQINAMKRPKGLLKRRCTYENKVYNDIIDMINTNKNLDEKVYNNKTLTLLCHAALYNLLDEARLLLAHHADPDIASDNASPLFTAAVNCNVSMVELLLKYNANPNPSSCLPLHGICKRLKQVVDLTPAKAQDGLTIIELLFAAGADHEQKDSERKTPLMHLRHSDSGIFSENHQKIVALAEKLFLKHKLI